MGYKVTKQEGVQALIVVTLRKRGIQLGDEDVVVLAEKVTEYIESLNKFEHLLGVPK